MPCLRPIRGAVSLTGTFRRPLSRAATFSVSRVLQQITPAESRDELWRALSREVALALDVHPEPAAHAHSTVHARFAIA